MSEKYIDPELDMKALEEGQQERRTYRGDTDDVDLENKRLKSVYGEED